MTELMGDRFNPNSRKSALYIDRLLANFWQDFNVNPLSLEFTITKQRLFFWLLCHFESVFRSVTRFQPIYAANATKVRFRHHTNGFQRSPDRQTSMTMSWWHGVENGKQSIAKRDRFLKRYRWWELLKREWVRYIPILAKRLTHEGTSFPVKRQHTSFEKWLQFLTIRW